MVIVGNSHITVFRDGCILPNRPTERVEIHWLALLITDFTERNVRAERARELLASHSGWRFLMIHFSFQDVVRILRDARELGFEAAVQARLRFWQEIFLELQGEGRFGWLMGMLQVKDTPAGCTEQNAIETCQTLTARMTTWCHSVGIPVVNPLPALGAESGRPKAEFLMPDGEHLRPRCADAYYKEIAAQTGEIVARKSLPADPPWPLYTKNPSAPGLDISAWHISQTFEEIGIPVKAPTWIEKAQFEFQMCQFLQEKLAERGIDLPIDPETDFVAESLVDSLSLIELMTHGADLLGIDIPFDVNLWSLPTVRKLGRHLVAHAPDSGGTRPPLLQSVFVESALPSGGHDPGVILERDDQISRMGIRRLIGLYLNAPMLMDEWHMIFGDIMPYWIALAEQRLGREDWARALLEKNLEAAAINSPEIRARMVSRLDAWERQRPVTWELPDARAYNILMVPLGDRNALRTGLLAYAATFLPDDDVALYLCVAMSEDELVGEVEQVIAESNLDPEGMADVVLVPWPRAEFTSALRAADLVIGSAEACAHARHLGRPAFDVPNGVSLRAAFTGFRGLPWPDWLASDDPPVFCEGALGGVIAEALDAKARARYLQAARILRDRSPFERLHTGLFSALDAA